MSEIMNGVDIELTKRIEAEYPHVANGLSGSRCQTGEYYMHFGFECQTLEMARDIMFRAIAYGAHRGRDDCTLYWRERPSVQFMPESGRGKHKVGDRWQIYARLLASSQPVTIQAAA